MAGFEATPLVGIAEPNVVTVDAGGTNLRVGKAGEEITHIERQATPRDYDTAIGSLAASSRIVLNGEKPDAIGVSVAGKIEDNRIVQAGELHNYGWTQRPFGEDIANELGIPPERVVLLNDCKAGANSERVERKLNSDEVGAFMTLSTGFGGALYKGDRLIDDEPGHEKLKPGAICGCGEDGCIEAWTSGAGIERQYGVPGEDIPHNDPRWAALKADFHRGMEKTLYRYHKIGLPPSLIGFTGSVALGGPRMLGDLQNHLDTYAGPASPKIVEAVHRDDSGLYGAAFAAHEQLEQAA